MLALRWVRAVELHDASVHGGGAERGPQPLAAQVAQDDAHALPLAVAYQDLGQVALELLALQAEDVVRGDLRTRERARSVSSDVIFAR